MSYLKAGHTRSQFPIRSECGAAYVAMNHHSLLAPGFQAQQLPASYQLERAQCYQLEPQQFADLAKAIYVQQASWQELQRGDAALQSQALPPGNALLMSHPVVEGRCPPPTAEPAEPSPAALSGAPAGLANDGEEKSQAGTDGSKDRRRRRGRGITRMAECLAELDHYPAERILRLSRLGRLGPEANTHVRTYFEHHFGHIERLLQVVEPHPGRQTPSNMLFLVMDTQEAVEKALAFGEEHEVLKDVPVLVRGFEARDPMQAALSGFNSVMFSL